MSAPTSQATERAQPPGWALDFDTIEDAWRFGPKHAIAHLLDALDDGPGTPSRRPMVAACADLIRHFTRPSSNRLGGYVPADEVRSELAYAYLLVDLWARGVDVTEKLRVLAGAAKAALDASPECFSRLGAEVRGCVSRILWAISDLAALVFHEGQIHGAIDAIVADLTLVIPGSIREDIVYDVLAHLLRNRIEPGDVAARYVSLDEVREALERAR